MGKTLWTCAGCGGVFSDGCEHWEGCHECLQAQSEILKDAEETIRALQTELLSLRALASRVLEVAEYFYKQGETCTFEGEPMVHLTYIEEFAGLAKAHQS